LIRSAIARDGGNNHVFFRKFPNFLHKKCAWTRMGVSRLAPENFGCEGALEASRSDIRDEETECTDLTAIHGHRGEAIPSQNVFHRVPLGGGGWKNTLSQSRWSWRRGKIPLQKLLE
jgi:hypothetical protein